MHVTLTEQSPDNYYTYHSGHIDNFKIDAYSCEFSYAFSCTQRYALKYEQFKVKQCTKVNLNTCITAIGINDGGMEGMYSNV